MSMQSRHTATYADDGDVLRELGAAALTMGSTGPLDALSVVAAATDNAITPEALHLALIRLAARHWLEAPPDDADDRAITLTPAGFAAYLHLHLPLYDDLLLQMKRIIVRHQQARSGSRLCLDAIAAAIGQPLIVASGLAGALQLAGLIGLERGEDGGPAYVGQVSVFLARQVRD